MRWLLDINILIALFLPHHVSYERAHHWWDTNRRDGWASCPLTQNGLVRIISQPKFAGANSAREALERLQTFTLRTDHEFWPDKITLLDEELFDRDHILGPNQVTDVYLLALAVKNSGRLATMDSAIPLAAVRGARREHLVVI